MVQLALEFDPLDLVDMARAERTLAELTAASRQPDPCRCDPKPELVGRDEDGRPACLHCGRRRPT